MAVLRHGQLALAGTTRCDHLIRFDDFAAVVKDFSRCLKAGGLLAIRHSNFRLVDAPAGADFETMLRVATLPADKLPLFGRGQLSARRCRISRRRVPQKGVKGQILRRRSSTLSNRISRLTSAISRTPVSDMLMRNSSAIRLSALATPASPMAASP